MTSFVSLCTLLNDIEKISSRLEIRSELANIYTQLSPTESAIFSYFILGRIAPLFVRSEFNLSKRGLITILTANFGLDAEELSKAGDLGGSLAERLGNKAGARNVSLSIEELYDKLWEIANIEGKGSVGEKGRMLTELLNVVTGVEAKFIIRIIEGQLRIGANERSLVEALSWSSLGNLNDKTLIESALNITSDIGHIAYVYKLGGAEELKKLDFVLGSPIAPKLVEREKSIAKILKRIVDPIEEPKYDGLRCQIHIFRDDGRSNKFERIWSSRIKTNNSVKDIPTLMASKSEDSVVVSMFSRGLENITGMFPEIVVECKSIFKQLSYDNSKFEGLVLDGEVIGYDSNTDRFLPFQETMTRKRKYNVEANAESTPVRYFVFDLLYFGNSSLLSTELRKRKSKLEQIKGLSNEIVLTPVHTPRTAKEAEELFLKYSNLGLEGVVFKDSGSFYKPGNRNFDWIKYKKSMERSLADTLDVVILGYYYGTGRLAKFGIGALLAGIYSKEANEFVTVTKIGTGITDELWQEIKLKCDALVVPAKPLIYNVPSTLTPNVWLTPQLVVEVEADEITKSPLHSSGYALRFPRFKKFREKQPTDSTSLEEVKRMEGDRK